MTGLSADERVRRLATLAVVLRELVHASAGRLALEPALEIKTTMAGHLHDDATAVTGLRARLAELGGDGADSAGPPASEVTALLDRVVTADGPAEYLAVAYGEVKPALVATAQAHLEHADPLAEEPTVRLLVELVHRQERHLVELGALPYASPDPLEPMPAAGERHGGLRELRRLPGLHSDPARDGYVEVVDDAGPAAADEPGRLAHGLVHSALWAAELAGRTSHEQSGLADEQHLELARQASDAARQAELIDGLMATELGTHWGEHPVDFAGFRAACEHDAAGRLEALSELAADRAAALDGLAAHGETVARAVGQLRGSARSTVPSRASEERAE